VTRGGRSKAACTVIAVEKKKKKIMGETKLYDPRTAL
jgi:hypothetical protein